MRLTFLCRSQSRSVVQGLAAKVRRWRSPTARSTSVSHGDHLPDFADRQVAGWPYGSARDMMHARLWLLEAGAAQAPMRARWQRCTAAVRWRDLPGGEGPQTGGVGGYGLSPPAALDLSRIWRGGAGDLGYVFADR